MIAMYIGEQCQLCSKPDPIGFSFTPLIETSPDMYLSNVST
jgi:hypothetical protein